MVSHTLDIHLTGRDALSAIDALGFLHLHTQKRNLIEESVKCAQGTQEAAEDSVDKDSTDDATHHQHKFPRKQRAQHAEAAFVDLVGEKSDRALERSRRAEILAKSRKREITEHIQKRNDKAEHNQNNVLEIGEQAGQSSLFDLRRGDLMEQILDQSKGTQKSADPATEQKAEQNNDTEYVVRNGFITACHSVLKSADGTRARRTGAGITIQAGRADVFQGSLVDLSVSKAL